MEDEDEDEEEDEVRKAVTTGGLFVPYPSPRSPESFPDRYCGCAASPGDFPGWSIKVSSVEPIANRGPAVAAVVSPTPSISIRRLHGSI